jgi:hypothetical protein
MAKKKSIFSTIDDSVRTGSRIMRTASKAVNTVKNVAKALSPDYKYNLKTGRYVKRKEKK